MMKSCEKRDLKGFIFSFILGMLLSSCSLMKPVSSPTSSRDSLGNNVEGEKVEASAEKISGPGLTLDLEKDGHNPSSPQMLSPKAPFAAMTFNKGHGKNSDKKSSNNNKKSKESKEKEEASTNLSKDNLISLEMNDMVQSWVDYFTVKDSDRFQRFLNQGQRYRDVVQTILKENDLPEELFYLAMIESGYSIKALSHAKALGVWQFIPGTARRYGLEVNKYVDERRDPIRATESAARYLSDLFNVFHSWELAMAAYNCGEICVLRAVMKGKSRDFWELVKKGLLPQETSHYVPKFMAAAIIGKDPENYGFNNPSLAGSDPYPSIEAVEMASPTNLNKVARLTGIDVEQLQEINPHLRKGMTPPNYKRYEIWVPKEVVPLVKDMGTTLASTAAENEENVKKEEEGNNEENITLAQSSEKGDQVKVAQASSEESGSLDNPHFHTIRKGDSLSKIAHRYGVSLAYLKKINQMRKGKIFPGQVLRISAKSYQANFRGQLAGRKGKHKKRGGSSSLHAASERGGVNGGSESSWMASGATDAKAMTKKYRVRNGDTLKKIARKYEMSINLLKRMNGLKRNIIYIGQLLNVVESERD